MLFAPIVTRIYGPSAYGLMGTFSAIIQIIGPIAAFSYPIAIVLSKDEKDANLTIKLSFYVTLFNTILFSLLLYFFHDYIVKTFNLISVSNYFYLIPLIVFFAGCLQILQQWLVRNNLFRISAKAYLVETVLVNSGKLIGGIIYPSASILILFTAFRQGIRVILMFIYSKINNVKEVLSLTTISDMKEVLKQGIKHKDFLIYRTPEVTLSALSANIPTLLLTAFFGPVSAGFYSIAKTVLAVPSTLIAQSVGDVFYPQVVRTAQNKQKITPLIIKSTFYLAVIGLIPYGFIFFFGPWLFGVVFGEEWIIAGEYARWVKPYR
ncbi:colanic acid exporter [Aerococcus viridans]|nr:colanic acid exporter [Aerococcus viridans]